MSETWCFKPGPYQTGPSCGATTSSESMMSTLALSDESATSVPSTIAKITSSKMTTEPPPETPSPSTRIKIQYEEDGEVFEQEDTYNNVTGEAKIAVPAHGNNSAVEVIMQESTVSKTINLTR
jgi:hypothetical protein